MKIIKDEVEILNKAKKTAYILAEKPLIVSKPDEAKLFLVDLLKKIFETRSTYKKLTKQVKTFKHLTHEVENIFDNYYIVDGAISDVLDNSVGRGFKRLVQVEKKHNFFIPRIYSILSELLNVSNYKIDRDTLNCFLQAYQTKAHLSIRELGFVPFFLKIILIENIQDVMLRSIVFLNDFKEAEYWFNQIVKKGERGIDKDYSKITSGMANKYGVIPVNVSFYLLQRLSQYGPDTRPVVKWLKLNLLKQGINISDLAEIENKRQDEISNQVSNIINSLRWINQARWDDFIVETNIIDSLLKKDPAGVYSTLDPASQSAYRNEVVKIGDKAGIYESEVAKLAIRLCHKVTTTNDSNDNPENHIGYYLVGAGRDELEKKIGYHKSFLEKIQSFVLRNASVIYLGSILLINSILTAALVAIFPVLVGHTFYLFMLIGLLFILNCDITVNLINIFISMLVPVRALFRLDLSSGLLLKQATFVVVPSMFRDTKGAEEILKRLEVNFIGNTDNNIYYALLMDFKDSNMEKNVSDQSLVDHIKDGIEKLNAKYPSQVKRFYLFHRRRIWNPHEGVFMGWERKRGKLREFNLFLRNKRQTSYVESLPADLPHIKYILTIDEDTRLPKDSAIKLIGCIDHPLNRPVLNAVTGKVISGYGIIQPRMTTKFSQARATAFSRLYSSAMGIDSYNGPAADVYQDLFSNSIFYGKGIYDIDTMEMTIGDKIPENQVLSHDLLEGLYTRVGFATDIFLFEGFPESYKEYILRMHRWIRGDWQIIGWLSNGGLKGSHFSFSDKWKIIDNLRRSTVPLFTTLFLLSSYLFFPNLYYHSLVYVLFIVGSPFIISYLIRLFEWPKEMTFFMKINTIFDNLDDVLWQVIYRFIFLLDQTVVSFRAITISTYRMLISHRHMLRWQNSHEVSKGLKGTLREFIYIMMPTQIISLIGLFVLPVYLDGFYLYLTLMLWFISPLIAYQISYKEKPYEYTIKNVRLLKRLACRSARFFLELSRRDGNKLIPDHYQEEPVTNSPAATSPTNIGMHLLSNFSAFDLGYLSFSDFMGRTLELCKCLDSLEKYKGHFYNWYDIRTLQPLNPKYVSSVDSANLAVNILTLKQGIIDIRRKPIINENSLSGLADVLSVLAEDAVFIIKDKTVSNSEKKLIRHVLVETTLALEKHLADQNVDSIERLIKTLNELSEINEKIKKIVSNLSFGSNHGILASVYSSAEHFNVLLKQQIEEIHTFMSFYDNRRTRPVIRNEKKNHLLSESLKSISLKLDTIPSIEYLSGGLRKEVENLDFTTLIHSANLDNNEKENIEHWYQQVLKSISFTEEKIVKNKSEYNQIILFLDKFFDDMNFSFMYNKERGLFHIGYNVTYEKIDNSYYDFLASEANSISFIAILKKEIPVKQWFYLGRKLVRLDGKNVLLSSWGGSLFEYLTSLIFFKTHAESLLGHTAKTAILGHINYGKKYKIPWGMGESAYSALDLNNNYQYQIFGHPALGFKRDLKDYLVVAPYVSIMSLAFRPKEAIVNIKKLIKNKFIGKYGFYDAVDYTQILNNPNSSKVGVPAKIYYAHHQGFSLQALNNQINKDRIYSLFSSDPRVESLDTLFEEKIPSSIPAKPIKNIERLKTEYLAPSTPNIEKKHFIPQYTSYPYRAFISNGSYTINISNTGASESKVSDICLTRFREDTVAEPWGQFIYIYDRTKDYLWSPTTAPTGVSLGKNKIEYFENKAKFNKIHNDIESSLAITVAADDDVEFRILTITNHGKDKKDLKLASYGEVSLSKSNEDLHHPSFEKLFVRSEYWQKYNALVYTRPNKVIRGTNLFFAHQMFVAGLPKTESVHTTDRSQFVGRGGSIKNLDIFSSHHRKIKSVLGHNFDPIFCFQNEIELKQNEMVTLCYINIFSSTKEDLIRKLKRYSNIKNVEQAVKKSDKSSYRVVNSLGMSQEQALSYQSLASRLLSPHYSEKIKKFGPDISEAAVQALWRLGISGDLPVLTVRFYDMNDLALVKNMLICHKYLKYKGIAHDLVLLNEYPSSYIKSFEDEVDFLVRYNQTPTGSTVRGGVHHLRSSHIVSSDKESLLSQSKIILDSKSGTLDQQILDILQSSLKTVPSYLKPIKKITFSGKDVAPDLTDLNFFNGLGGFDDKKREYVMNINYLKSVFTPSPWVNIIANKNIGSVITESGSAYTWLYDSYDNRLTKRIDDPLVDRSSEVFYVRDEETGEFWNPTPLPIKSAHTYTVKHGLNYTKFEHKSRGLDQEMISFVPVNDSVKIVKFKFTNTGKTAKKLSLTGFFEMSLGGASRESTKDYLKTSIDEETKTLIIKNIFTESFKNTLAFIDFNGGECLITNDRDEFLGKGGNIINPGVMGRDRLSNIIHDDVDHCIGVQTFFELEPGKDVEIVSVLGGSRNISDLQGLVRKYRNISELNLALDKVKSDWDDILNKVQIKTPDESLNTLFNSRLLYQLISSRLLARTGYYQPSGAYGFRDQLQDSMALVWSKPDMTKEIILKASRHQFVEGDGMNWWHEHNDFGVRNAFSDHQLWLPNVVSYYLEITGDLKILDEKESYLKAPLLDFINNPNWAGVAQVTTEKYDLYDHCLRAIEKTFVFGEHGLPLIGNGDWNDGLNKVGEKGQGESVWLGWFLISVIDKFVPYIKGRGDLERVKRYEVTAKNLKLSLEKSAWDGKWYKRAFFDNGASLGSRSNKEFKIDSISQSWSVLSGAGKPERAKQAMNSVSKHLFQDDLLLLISPAVKNSQMDPGYIKDYPAGVRENGAQYNHAALWSAQAYALLKDPVSMMKIIDSVNPIKRSLDIVKTSLYRVEPYVVASDIYAKPEEAGRGGWTWYTGSAGVMYRTILESLLGLKVRGNTLQIDPCLPKNWTDYSIIYTYKNTKYNIHIINNSNAFVTFPSAKLEMFKHITLDGVPLVTHIIDLVDDQKDHEVEVGL